MFLSIQNHIKVFGFLALAVFVGLNTLSPLTTDAQYGGPSLIITPGGNTTGGIENINVTSGESLTVRDPISGLSEIVFTFRQAVSNGSIRYTITPITTFGEYPEGTGILSIKFETTNIVTTTVNVALKFVVNETFADVKAYVRNSPAIAIPVTQLGNGPTGFTEYSASTNQIPEFFGVSASTSTVRTGSLNIYSILSYFIISGILIMSTWMMLVEKPTTLGLR